MLSLAVFLSVYAIIQLAGVTVREKSAVRQHRAPQSADSDDSNGRVAASIPWPSSKSQITQTDERCRWKRALGNWCALNAVVTPSPAMRIDGEENGHRKPIMLVFHNDTCHYYMYKGLKCKKVPKYWKVSKIYAIGTSSDGEGGFFYYGMFCKQTRCWLGAIYLFLTIHSSA